MGKESV